MKNLSNKEKFIVVLCTVTVLLSVTALIGQIRLLNYFDGAVSTGDETAVTINWFEEETEVPDGAEASEASETGASYQVKRYIINLSSKKIHSPDCQFADKISEENSSEIYTDNLSEYIDKGYSICSKCNAE